MPTKARIPIPADLSPAAAKCFQFEIPEDSEWLGMFWGALYQLTAWNSYDRDGSNSGKTMADAWKDILDTARLSTCGADCPGFYLVTDDINCVNTADLRTVREVQQCDGCGCAHAYFSRSTIDLIAGVARIGYRFHDCSDDTLCGGHVCRVAALQTGIGYPNWNLTWVDCLGTTHEVLDAGTDEFVLDDFEATRICLSLNSNFCAVVTVDGPVLCGVA
jgi:hypothetical protein